MPTLIAIPSTTPQDTAPPVPSEAVVTCPRLEEDLTCGVTGTTTCPTDPNKQRTCPIC